MTTLEKWIDFSITVMEENVAILKECQKAKKTDLLVIQAKTFKKHVDSFIDFLEREGKFGSGQKLQHNPITFNRGWNLWYVSGRQNSFLSNP